jgi:hypothetical protein
MSQESPVSHTSPSSAPTEAESEILDADWLSAPSRHSRFRIGAVVALAVLLVFLGGVEVQKRWGAGDSSSTSGPPTGSFPAGASFPAGGVSGLPTGGTGTPSGTQDKPTTSGTTTPAVIGTLTRIRGDTWTVKDLGGKTHSVKVTATTTLTRSLARASAPIRTGTGTGVTVQGTTQGDTITATAITLR